MKIISYQLFNIDSNFSDVCLTSCTFTYKVQLFAIDCEVFHKRFVTVILHRLPHFFAICSNTKFVFAERIGEGNGNGSFTHHVYHIARTRRKEPIVVGFIAENFLMVTIRNGFGQS